MKHFWQGFIEKKSTLQFKEHQIVLFWAPGEEKVHSELRKIASRYPSVRLKLVNIRKNPEALEKFAVVKSPTVMLLKYGREIDRIHGIQRMIIEQMFRRAGT